MKITKLQVTNFRNLEPDIITFGSGINCIFGDNGNGKTNILEAIYYLIQRKSFRKNTSFPQMISIDGENQEILFSSLFKSMENEDVPYSGKVTSDSNFWYLDGKSTKKKIEVGVVFINPFDSQQFHTSSTFRRHWIDTYLSQISPEYKKNLSKYTKFLRNRNTLLSKKPYDYKGQITALDRELAPIALDITKQRVVFLEQMNTRLRDTFFELFSESHELVVSLDSKLIDKKEDFFLELMKSNSAKDEIIGRTQYGVHLDDYVLLFDGLNSYDFCSLGQQKMSYLSLLFAYTELFRYKFTSFPIVLLDDVSGELDSLRWQRLVDYLKQKEFQVLITTANDKFKEGLDTITGATKIEVAAGSIHNA